MYSNQNLLDYYIADITFILHNPYISQTTSSTIVFWKDPPHIPKMKDKKEKYPTLFKKRECDRFMLLYRSSVLNG
jgi:hypothetical protein